MDTTKAMRLSDSAAPARTACEHVTEFEMPSTPGSVSRIRARVHKFARSMGFTSECLDDICIAVGEASTNALKHGYNLSHPLIGVRMESCAGTLKVFITDAGPGFDPSAVCPPCEGDLCECGRGLMCMRVLMDEVYFHALNPGTQVEMVKHVRAERQ